LDPERTRFNPIDDAFYRLERRTEELYGLARQFVLNHPEEFFLPPSATDVVTPGSRRKVVARSETTLRKRRARG
jgi:hypothetical protein